MADSPLKVFVSYSWGEGEDYRNWVKQLVARLRENGVDATSDAWKPEGRTIPEYMNSEVRKAHRVLVLCSPTFRTKVHQTEDGIGETGVGWESALITGAILAGIADAKAKVLPVLTRGEWKTSAPDFLLGYEWSDLRNEATFENDYSRLLKRILGRRDSLPPLGPPPDFPDVRRVEPLRGPGATPDTGHRDTAAFGPFARQLVGNILPSRSPIMIAIEQADARLDDTEVLRAERHLSITLTREQVEELERLGNGPTGAQRTIPEVMRDGERVFDILGDSSERLSRLFQGVTQSANPQPIAWTAESSLLLRIHKALLIARTEFSDGSRDFLSVASGDHYFCPILPRGSDWGMPRRAGTRVVAKVLNLGENGSAAPHAELASASGCEIAILNAPNITSGVRDLAELMRRQHGSRTRVAVAIGEMNADAALLADVLSQIPCVSIGAGLQHDGLPEALGEAFPTLGPVQAAPTVLAAFRREWVTRAISASDHERFSNGIFWSTWSRVGKPLFADEFGEVMAPTYPHLTDLRSVKAKDWYYKRRESIDEPYTAADLTSKDGKPFHLYLSGAGGTGKSCFLRFVYDQLVNRPNVLAVWYRVDAPSSEWENVEQRVREETEQAVRRKPGLKSKDVIPAEGLSLREFLDQLADNLRNTKADVNEVVVFIDQLERTFESGDEPDLERLMKVSTEVIDLLKVVKVGEGVRVFIASRKQYLPDFLRSFHAADLSGLHFNILQSIDPETERLGFVRHVLKWCQDQGLVQKAVTIEPPAATLLAKEARGHPLEMMLALIHLFSQDLSGPITPELLAGGKDPLRPWDKLFDFDLQFARKDPLSWFFLLAMAQARTEIVGFEEVWWRLHLVDPVLTRRIDLLEPPGVLEWLWLRGQLGRTIHARPDATGNDRARFLEFFHANLRDHLLENVMSRSGETPAAWRALDQLSAIAHDWEQFVRLLNKEDVHALIAHQQFTVEPTGRKGSSERDVFYLLFLRDAGRARPTLCKAAKECFVLSALVHDESGRWAFHEVFRDVAAKIDCCDRWLKRDSPYDHRPPVLQYLVDHDTPETRRFLAELVLAGDDSAHAGRWAEIARVLEAPLYAARYRGEVVIAVLQLITERNNRVNGVGDLPPRFRDFVVESCGGNRDELLRMLTKSADHLEGLDHAALRLLGAELRTGNIADKWLGDLRDDGRVARLDRGDEEDRARAPIQLVRGTALALAVTPAMVTQWRQELSERLGTPLPLIALSDGEEGPDDLELRLRGRRVAAEPFFPPLSQVLKRQWESTTTFTPPEAKAYYSDVLREDVLWLDPSYLRQNRWELPMWTAGEAMLRWLEILLRRHFDLVFDYDLLIEFARTTDVRGISLPRLRQVTVNLVHESVPVGDHWPEITEELQRGNASPVVLTQNLRERLGAVICAGHTDKYGQLWVIILDEVLEKRLMKRLRTDEGTEQLPLDPAEADALTGSIIRHVARCLRENDVMPVVACERSLRAPLLHLIERFDPRVHVISYTELSPALRLVDAGMVVEKAEAAVPAYS